MSAETDQYHAGIRDAKRGRDSSRDSREYRYGYAIGKASVKAGRNLSRHRMVRLVLYDYGIEEEYWDEGIYTIRYSNYDSYSGKGFCVTKKVTREQSRLSRFSIIKITERLARAEIREAIRLARDAV